MIILGDKNKQNPGSRERKTLPAGHTLRVLLSAPEVYSHPMPSFDIVSQVNSMEIENAVNQAKKELANRFDFKGTKAEIVLEKTEIKLSAENAFKLKALTEIVLGKI